ncbi:MAG: hypothetical protein WDW38_006849 [Sanguina aurantia]
METPKRKLRVVSLLPSATELIVLVGGEDLLVARSHECDYPSTIQHLPFLTAATNQFISSWQMDQAVGEALQQGQGLYTIDAEALKALKPDLIITQSLCSVCSVDLDLVQRITKTMDPRPRVISLNPMNLTDVIADVLMVGEALGMAEQGRVAAAALTARLQAVLGSAQVYSAAAAAAKLALGGEEAAPGADVLDAVEGSSGAAVGGAGEVVETRKTVAFLEWLDPIFCGGHWTPQMIEMAGGCHPLNKPSEEGGGAPPSFVIDPAAILKLQPYWVVLCPCGLDMEMTFKEVEAVTKQPWWNQLTAVHAGPAPDERRIQGRHRCPPDPRCERLRRPAPARLTLLLCCRPSVVDGGGVAAAAAGVPPSEREEDAESEIVVEGKKLPVGGRRAGCVCPVPGAGWTVAEGLIGTPDLGVEIEDAHRASCTVGRGTYSDPKTGYAVFTEGTLLGRGECCGNRCRHCPYGHFKVTSKRGNRLNRILRPLFLRCPTKAVATAVAVAKVAAAAAAAAAASDSASVAGSGSQIQLQSQSHGCKAVAECAEPKALMALYFGDEATRLSTIQMQAEGKTVTWVVASDIHSEATWSSPAALSSSSSSGACAVTLGQMFDDDLEAGVHMS